MPEEVRRLEVDEVRDRKQRVVDVLPYEHDRERRLGIDHRAPDADGVEPRQDHVAFGLDQAGEHRVEVPTAPLPGELPRGVHASESVRDLDVLGHLRHPGRERDVVSLELAGPAAAVPALVRRTDRLDDLVRQRELLRHRAGDRGVVGDHPVDLAVPREREREAEPEPVERRAPGPELPHSRRRHPQAPRLVVVLDRLEGDVIAEPLGLLVRVRMAADVDEQSRVVDDRPLLLVQPEPLGEPQRDQALSQHMLHRLPEAEVDPERERGQRAPPSGPARDRSRRPLAVPSATNDRAIAADKGTRRLASPAMPSDAGYSGTPLPQKLGIREGDVVCVVDDPGQRA